MRPILDFGSGCLSGLLRQPLFEADDTETPACRILAFGWDTDISERLVTAAVVATTDAHLRAVLGTSFCRQASFFPHAGRTTVSTGPAQTHILNCAVLLDCNMSGRCSAEMRSS